MTIELALTIGLILGLAVGIAIDRQARRERDERIKDLEKELGIKQNVVESQNDSINRLCREIKRLKKDKYK